MTLSDSMLNLYKDQNFESCNLCVCNMNILGNDLGLYLPREKYEVCYKSLCHLKYGPLLSLWNLRNCCGGRRASHCHIILLAWVWVVCHVFVPVVIIMYCAMVGGLQHFSVVLKDHHLVLIQHKYTISPGIIAQCGSIHPLHKHSSG